jgi:hypothetical protein
MKLDRRALAYAAAALWAGAVLLVGLVNLGDPTYGLEFLELLGSVYPGYKVERTLESVLVATGYALFEGALAGWLFGWLYHRVTKKP